MIDVIEVFRYQETSFGKKDYTVYLKNYMKKVKAYLEEKNPARVEAYKKGA